VITSAIVKQAYYYIVNKLFL